MNEQVSNQQTQNLTLVPKKQRNAKMDLLRVFAMLFIVMLHLVENNMGLESIDGGALLPLGKFVPMALANCISIIGVNLFFMLSGYFKINATLSKALKLIFKVYVYWIVGTLLAWAIGVKSFENAWDLLAFCVIGISKYWFIIVYILLMLATPLLNAFIDIISQKGLTKYFIAVTIVLFVISGFVTDIFYPYFGTGNGFLPVWAWVVYCYGRMIRITEDKIKIKFAPVWWLLATLVNFAVIMLVYVLTKDGSLTLHFFAYNSPFVFLCSILFFIMFLKSKMGGKLVSGVAKLAPYVLAVYLWHSNHPLVSPYRAALIDLVNPLWAKFLLLIPNALILFALGVTIDFIYELTLGKAINKLCVRIEAWCKKIFTNLKLKRQ